MKAVQCSLDLFEKNTDLEKGPRVAFMEIVAELIDPGNLVVYLWSYLFIFRSYSIYTHKLPVMKM